MSVSGTRRGHPPRATSSHATADAWASDSIPPGGRIPPKGGRELVPFIPPEPSLEPEPAGGFSLLGIGVVALALLALPAGFFAWQRSGKGVETASATAASPATSTKGGNATRTAQKPVRPAYRLPGPGAPSAVETIAGLQTAMWLPAPAGNGRLPLVVFTHGLGGCNLEASFLMRALAEDGYVVMAPNHRDSACVPRAAAASAAKSGPAQPAADAALERRQREETARRERTADVSRLLAAMERDAEWASRIDWSSVAIAGRGLGACAVLGFGGAWAGWSTGGIEVKAAVALAPTCPTAPATLARLGVPVMWQGDARGLGEAPRPAASGKPSPAASARAPLPRVVLVGLPEATAAGWTDRAPDRHDIIARHALAFLDAHLRDPHAIAASGDDGEQAVVLSLD